MSMAATTTCREETEPEVSAERLSELAAMGFARNKAVRALHRTGYNSIEQAINWLLEHENAADRGRRDAAGTAVGVRRWECAAGRNRSAAGQAAVVSNNEGGTGVMWLADVLAARSVCGSCAPCIPLRPAAYTALPCSSVDYCVSRPRHV